jgi:PAS domain S-box-containing protein
MAAAAPPPAPADTAADRAADGPAEPLGAPLADVLQPPGADIFGTVGPESFPLESSGGEPLGLTLEAAVPAAPIRIGFAGDVEQARVLASIDASIEIVPMTEVTAGSEPACVAIVVDQSHVADVAQVLNDVRTLSLPAILLYDPAAAESAFRAFASEADEFVANDGDWMRQVKERIALAAERSQRHREFAAIKAREARLRATIDTLPAAVVRLSAEGTVLAANGVATSLFGATESRQLLRKQFYSFVSAADRDLCIETVSLASNGESRSIDVWATTLEGESRAIQINAVPVPSDAGGAGAVLAVVRDVTDRKRLEVSLEQAMAHTGSALGEPPAVMAPAADTATPAAASHESDSRPVVERTVATTLDIDSMRALEAQLHQLSREARQSFELLETSLREAEAHHDSVATRQREEQAAFEAAQSERWRSYDAFVQSAAHPILQIAGDGRLIAVNPAFVTLLGDASADALLARAAALEAVTPIEDWRAAAELWREGDGTASLETRWKRVDGSTLSLLMHGRRISGDTAANERIEVIVENVTARRTLERQLKRAQRWEDVAKVTTGLAADLQQAVRSLNASAELAADTSSPSMLADLRQQAAHAETLSRQLVAFGRREARQPAQLDLNAMVHEVETLLRRVADEHVELTIDLARQVDMAQADRAVIGEALIGLTMAAASALPAGGRIHVATLMKDIASRHDAPEGVAPGAYAVLQVTAAGWGLTPADALSASGPVASIRQAVERGGGSLVVTAPPDGTLDFAVYLALVAETVEV